MSKMCPAERAILSGARFLDPDLSPSAFDWPAFSAEILGRGRRARLFLLTFARCEARR